ncbi:MAG: NAD(P)H-hydrate epimerase [Pirellula sp.]
MNPEITVNQIRLVDKIAVEQFGMLSLVLMENAGRGAADLVNSLTPSSHRVLVLCGPGNNGGDGLVIARHLDACHRQVSVLIVGDRNKLSRDALSNLLILEKTSVPIEWLAPNAASTDACLYDVCLHRAMISIENTQVIVDALLGTGARGSPRGTMANLIDGSNRSAAFRVAIDIPTGLDAESGVASEPTFRADYTLTFVACKTGFRKSGAANWLGKVLVLPIGVPPQAIEIALETAV